MHPTCRSGVHVIELMRLAGVECTKGDHTGKFVSLQDSSASKLGREIGITLSVERYNQEIRKLHSFTLVLQCLPPFVIRDVDRRGIATSVVLQSLGLYSNTTGHLEALRQTGKFRLKIAS